MFFECVFRNSFGIDFWSIRKAFGMGSQWFLRLKFEHFRMTKTMKIIKNPRVFEDFTGCEGTRWIMKISFFVPCLFIWFGPLWNQFFQWFWSWFSIDLSVNLIMILGIGFSLGFGLDFHALGPQNLPPPQTHQPTNLYPGISRYMYVCVCMYVCM